MNGLLLIDKPLGYTSHDAVARTRKALNTRAVGHAGTLDPLATGLLIVCVGYATRLSEYVLGADKTYSATLRLGERTNTDDAEGEVIQTRPVPPIDQAQLARIQQQFSGTQQQIPPPFSAIKRNGVRAYEMARRGEQIELAARAVTIYNLALAPTDEQHLMMQVTCSSGTYVRALARDIGEALGCGAHLTQLRRTSIGDFDVRDATPLDQLSAATPLLAPDRAVTAFVAVELSAEHATLFARGMQVSPPTPIAAQTMVRVYDSTRQFIGIGETRDGRIQPLKVFVHS